MTGGADWTGRVGDVWAAEWRRTDRSFADLSRHLDAAILGAAPAGAFRALDIGCGAGATSLALAAARKDATIIGVDLSAGLVDVAHKRAASGAALEPATDHHGDARVGFHVADATMVADAEVPFDLLFSRHGVMFFDDPAAAFAALRRAGAPGARLVFSCFRNWSLNAFACELAEAVGGKSPEDGPGPFALADANRTGHLLTQAGWIVDSVEPIDFGYRAGEGGDPVADALEFLQRIGPAAAALRSAEPNHRVALLDRMRTVVEGHHSGGAVDFPAAAWIWSATAPAKGTPHDHRRPSPGEQPFAAGAVAT